MGGGTQTDAYFRGCGAILLMVYSAFGAAVRQGIWRNLPAPQLAMLFLICCVLLALVLAFSMGMCRRIGLAKADEIAIVFCGSKKSLITGIPMANILFTGPTAAVIVLPLILFHQIQLIVCAILAARYAATDSRDVITPKLARP